MHRMKNMLIVEDNPFVAESTKSLFLTMPDVNYVEICSNMGEALCRIRNCDWYRIWLDIDIPGAHGLSLVRHVSHLGLADKAAIITGSENHRWRSEVESMGFLGNLIKTATIDQIKRGLSENMQSRPNFDRSQCPMQGSNLTGRQIEILNLLYQRNCSKKIAQILNLSPGTVENHISNIVHALGANDRTHALALAIQFGYIQVTH